MDYSIKDLPESERPREKLRQEEVSSLTDVELLSLVLRTGTTGKNVKELSSEILKSYSLAEISNVPEDQLKRLKGVSDVKAGQLKAVSELGRRIKREERTKIENFLQLKSVVSDMKLETEEKIRVILLKSSNEVIDIFEIEGTVDSVNFETKELLSKILSRNASGFIMAHNHPSGRAEPTEKDIETTEKLLDASRTVGVNFLDHVVVGEEISSMRKGSDLEFP